VNTIKGENGRQTNRGNKESTVTKKVNGGTIAAKVVKVSKVRVLYDERRAFVAEHGKAIAAEFAKEGEKASWWFVWLAMKPLSATYIGYTLQKLGLIKSSDKRITKLIEADKAFSPLIKGTKNGKPKALVVREAKEAASVARFKVTEAQAKA